MTPEELELRVSLAEIKGMLTSNLARHEQRLDQHEGTLKQHDATLVTQGQASARQDERIKDLEEDNAATFGRVTGILALIVAAGSLLLNYLT